MSKPEASPSPPTPNPPPVEPREVENERDYEASHHYDQQDRERIKSNKVDDEAARKAHPKGEDRDD